jgi:hypothetical protein
VLHQHPHRTAGLPADGSGKAVRGAASPSCAGSTRASGRPVNTGGRMVGSGPAMTRGGRYAAACGAIGLRRLPASPAAPAIRSRASAAPCR